MINGCKEYKDKIKGFGCCVCGYKKCLSALDFHHLYGEKDKLISSITSLPRLKREIEKNRVVVLCAVCHREVHEGLISDNYLESSVLVWGDPNIEPLFNYSDYPEYMRPIGGWWC